MLRWVVLISLRILGEVEVLSALGVLLVAEELVGSGKLLP